MPRDFPRTRRVAEQMQRELAVIIRDEVKDPRLGMVSVSAVEVSKDLSNAKVFITVLGEEGKGEESVAILNKAAGFLRHALGQQMVIRTVPHLKFVHDRSLEQGAHMSALIDAAVSADSSKSRDEQDEEG